MKRHWFTHIIFALFLLSITQQLLGQSKVDSLLQLTKAKKADQVYAAHMALAELFAKDDSVKANSHISRVFEKADELSDSVLHELMVNVVVFHTKAFNHQRAIKAAKKVLSIAQKRKDTFLLAESCKRLSASFFMSFNYDSTSKYLKKAAEYYTQIKDSSNYALMIMREGGVHYAKGEYDLAMRKAFKATELFKEIDQSMQLAHAYMQLGNIYYFLKAHEEAAYYYKLSADYYLLMQDTMGWAFAHSNYGLAKIEQDSFRLGLKIQQKALPIIRKSGRQISLGNTFHYIGICYLGLKQLDSAQHYIRMALDFNKKSKYTPGIAYDYKELGQIALERNQLDSALFYGKKAFATLDSIINYEASKEVNFFLAETYEKLGYLDSALIHQKQYISLLDSTDYNENDIERMAFNQQSKLERAQYELKLSQQRELIKEKENQSQQFLIIVLSIIAVISIFFAGVISSSSRRNKHLNKELQNKQALLESELKTKQALLKEIHHRVKNNLQIISSMLSIQSQYSDSEKLDEIIRESRSRIMSMSLIHESLYKREDNDHALFSAYVKELIPKLIDTYHVDESKVHLSMDINELELSLDDSVPCGLIINEIISNSLKHAFPDGREGNISIKMYKDDDQTIHLKLADDGVGLPKDINPKKQDTFGFLLLYSLVNQLEAQIEVSNQQGVSFHIYWRPKNDKLLS